MREIKFRAWIWEEDKMCEATQLTPCGDFCHAYISELDYTYQLDIKYIMQYTGLKDRNGVEIYEGDIVKDRFGIGPIVWDTEIAAFAWKGGEDWGMIDSDSIEVIGNIYDKEQHGPNKNAI